jgi:peroxiredoxin
MSSVPDSGSGSSSGIAPVKKRHVSTMLLWAMPLLLVGLVVVYGFLTRGSAGSDANTHPRVGQPVADFALPELQGGRRVQLSDLHGKVVFINVWATWCQPCIDEMPTIQQLYEQMRSRGLEVLTISLDPLGAQIVEPFMRRYDLSFPVLLDTKSQVEKLYGTTGVPESFIVDKNGRLVEKVIGPRDWSAPETLAMFQRLLAAPSTPSNSQS